MIDTRNLDKNQDHSEQPACFDELNRGISADAWPELGIAEVQHHLKNTITILHHK